MFHDNLLLYIRKLKDSQNRYLFQDAAAGAPPTIWGSPLRDQPAHGFGVTTTQKTIVYGQLNKYKIRDVQTIRLRRLVERYADSDQEGFVAFMRSDGNLLDAGVAPVKYLVQVPRGRRPNPPRGRGGSPDRRRPGRAVPRRR
jgi:HK97 family phage major capsid protein